MMILGILVMGSEHNLGKRSVEVWSPSEEGSCVLENFPRDMANDPTINFISGRLIACFWKSCEIYNNGTGAWTKLSDTNHARQMGSAAQKDDKVLLIAGWSTRSTEWIPLDGSGSQNGPISSVRHKRLHCTIQVSDDVIIVTGGAEDTNKYVTEYQLSDGTSTVLADLTHGRDDHACAVYQDAADQQVT